MEKEMATHSSLLSMENAMDNGTWLATIHGIEKESDTT